MSFDVMVSDGVAILMGAEEIIGGSLLGLSISILGGVTGRLAGCGTVIAGFTKSIDGRFAGSGGAGFGESIEACFGNTEGRTSVENRFVGSMSFEEDSVLVDGFGFGSGD